MFLAELGGGEASLLDTKPNTKNVWYYWYESLHFSDCKQTLVHLRREISSLYVVLRCIAKVRRQDPRRHQKYYTPTLCSLVEKSNFPYIIKDNFFHIGGHYRGWDEANYWKITFHALLLSD